MSIDVSELKAGYNSFEIDVDSLYIPTGSFTALIGPNGSGKSTLLKAISGHLRLRSGKIYINNQDLTKTLLSAIARLISFQTQQPIVPDGITVEQLVGYGRAPYQNFMGIKSDNDLAKIKEALQTVDIEQYSDTLVTQLSGGQRQRAFIAMCIAQDTPYILLDEPISSLDIKYQYEVLDLLQKLNLEGRTIIVVLHDIALAARYSANIIIMKDGRVCHQGSPSEVLTSSVVESVYELPAYVYPDPIVSTVVMTRKKL